MIDEKVYRVCHDYKNSLEQQEREFIDTIEQNIITQFAKSGLSVENIYTRKFRRAGIFEVFRIKAIINGVGVSWEKFEGFPANEYMFSLDYERFYKLHIKAMKREQRKFFKRPNRFCQAGAWVRRW